MGSEEYQQDWRNLNRILRGIQFDSGDLRASIGALQAHHLGSGFIRQNLEGVQRYTFCDPELGHRCLRIQYNPTRAARFRGAGDQRREADTPVVNDGCFLCRENIEWQQQGRQIGFELEANGNHYIAWMNPFPLLPSHFVAATAEHIGQEWSLHPDGELSPQRIVRDLVSMAAEMPGFAGFYNGVGAGASLPGHMHYQFFRPPPEHRQFPLEIEAAAMRRARPGQWFWRLGQYPLEAAHWHGRAEDITEPALAWIQRWAYHQDRLPELTANVLTITDSASGEISLYFVPRDRNRSRASCMAGLVGGLEVLGELVFSTEDEKALLDSGQLNYFNLKQVLAEVCTPLNMPEDPEL